MGDTQITDKGIIHQGIIRKGPADLKITPNLTDYNGTRA